MSGPDPARVLADLDDLIRVCWGSGDPRLERIADALITARVTINMTLPPPMTCSTCDGGGCPDCVDAP